MNRLCLGYSYKKLGWRNVNFVGGSDSKESLQKLKMNQLHGVISTGISIQVLICRFLLLVIRPRNNIRTAVATEDTQR